MKDPLELDEESHWSASWTLCHPLALEAPLEPAWDRLSTIRRRWRHDIQRIRAEVVDEEETAAWMARRKSWVRATYSTPDKPAPTQVLVFLELLRLLGYPRHTGTRGGHDRRLPDDR